jgi:3-methyladenine DNA glycosylase Tag
MARWTPQAEAFATQLKSQGYRFVGPASASVFMQDVGVVNDHVHGCFRGRLPHHGPKPLKITRGCRLPAKRASG